MWYTHTIARNSVLFVWFITYCTNGLLQDELRSVSSGMELNILKSIYVAFTAGILVGLNVKKNTSKAILPHVLSTHCALLLKVLELRCFSIPVNWKWPPLSGAVMTSVFTQITLQLWKVVSQNWRSMNGVRTITLSEATQTQKYKHHIFSHL